MKKLILSSIVIASFVSCGGSGGGGSKSSKTGLIPLPDIECSGSACISANSLTSKDANTVGAAAIEYYTEAKDDVLPSLETLVNKVSDVLVAAGNESCSAIPTSGTDTADGIELVYGTPVNANIFGANRNLTKKLIAKKGGVKFFEAEFSCEGTSFAGYIIADFSIYDADETMSTAIYFNMDGDTKKVSIYETYTESSKNQSYILNFSSNGNVFEASFAWDGDLSSTAANADSEEIYMISYLNNKSNVSYYNPSNNVNLASSLGSPDENYCFDGQVLGTGCPAFTVLSQGSNIEGLNSTTSGSATGEFSIAKLRALSISL